MPRTPRIGMATYGPNAAGDLTLGVRYVECVRRAGGTPLLLPPGEPQLEESLAGFDGVVLCGGPDVEPGRYGGRAHPAIVELDPARDASEFELARLLVEQRIPTLCICRGLQLLNVAFGGTLVEHLPDEVGTRVPHDGVGGAYVLHEVRLEPGSRLAALLERASITSASSHHQAVRAPAPGFVVAARAPDGTIEALEHAQHEQLIAVQWHPEYTAHTDALQQRLFDEFVRWTR
ncbi:MAG: gamma-glutamyl-gamma-aminobutyrate hydrolase family protein [Planctomycetes bacterium]|nr:gamma-glutamyl-gamma-aminobutyrate hydrolase family protein [Planctomycetota bacterium]